MITENKINIDDNDSNLKTEIWNNIWRATARQRAEAYCRTIKDKNDKSLWDNLFKV